MTRILIVDDKEENLAYLRALLTSHDCTVEAAHQGAEALAMARRSPPDVVISDLLMPVMDGYTLLRHWKADARLGAVPFIVYTATYTDPEDEQLALNLGADAFVLKPSDPAHLIGRLREVQANASSAHLRPPRSAVGDEKAQLKLYNESLVRKLEEKTVQLEAANRALRDDIARREATEEALRASEATMAAGQRLAHFGSWELDLTLAKVDANPLRWSDEMFRIAGYEPGAVEVSSEFFFGAVPVEEHEAIRQAVAGAIRERRDCSIVHRLIRPGGEERIVHQSAQILFDATTRAPLKMVGTAQDITERRQAEEALRASEKEFRDLAEAMPQIVWITRPDGRTTYFNRQWADYTGLPEEESLGDAWITPFHPDDRQRALDAWQHATTVIDNYALECRLRRADGTYRWWLIRGVPVRDAGGDVAKWFGTCIDIHDLKHAELQRHQLAERHTRTLEGLTDGFCTLDPDWRFTYMNPVAERMLARPRDEIIGKVIWTLFPGGADSVIGQGLQRAMTEQGLVQLTERYPPSDHWFDLRIYGSAHGLVIYARDVTHQRRVAAELEVERARLTQAQAVARMGSWDTDLTTGVVIWSEQMHHIFESDPATFKPTHRAFLALVHPEDRAAVEAAFLVSLEVQAPQSIEHRVLLPDGRIKTIEERWQLFRDAGGTPVRALGSCLDITERRQAEQQLRRSQAMVELAGRMARMGAWSVELPPVTVHWSDVVAAIHDEPVGTSPTVAAALDYYAPEHRGTIDAHFVRCVEQGEPFDLELQIVTSRGQRRWVRVIGQPERDEAGRILRVQGAFQEIDDRKAAEQATRELAERLQNTLESITDAFITLDAQWRFTYVNRQAEQLLARDRVGLLGRGIWAEFPAAAGGVVQQQYERAVRDGVATAFEFHYPPLNRWFEVNAYPSAQGLAIYFRDMTGRKQTQDALRELNAELEARVLARTAELNKAREEAEFATQAKSAFLATMSHEIRTPMNGVIGMIDVLHQTSLKGDQVEMVDLIRDSAYSLLGIIEDILDFSKIEAGRMEIERAPLCLADLVESVCGMLDHTAIKRDVRMALFVDPSIPSALVGDEARLRQVLVNLVGNALKFCSGRDLPGRVAVRARLRARDAETATVEISVADNGIGMDEPTVARLFTPFTQGDASTTRRFGGTGLGLAITGTLVKLMGGEISVHSAAGHGATFTVVLTFAVAEGEAPSEPAAALIAGLRCCLVGSDMPLGDDIAAYLNCAGVSVDRAAEPSTAGPAPLWVLLPSQTHTGIDTLRELAGRAGGAQTRFFLLGSGYRRRPRVESHDLVLLDHCGLTRRSLYRTVALATGRLTIDAVSTVGLGEPRESGDPTAVPRGSLASRRSILVAEDNETNRKVIKQQLQLVGFDADFAEDGQRALELWRSGDFGLVFTDLHMPRMDGYALVRAIRTEEQAQGGRRTAVVALTANALRDEELRCKAAGMDAYLSKPVRLARLQAAIEEWLPARAETVVRAAAQTDSPGSTGADGTATPVVDLSVLKGLIGDDETVLADVLRAFRTSATQSRSELSRAGADGDLRAVADTAHKLKSGAFSIGAQQLGERCSELEAAAESGMLSAVATLLSLLEADLRAVLESLEDT